MQRHHRWILGGLLLLALFLGGAIIAAHGAINAFCHAVMSHETPALRTLPQIQPVVGVLLPSTATIEYAWAAYDGILFESWIFKTPTQPFTLKDISTFNRFQHNTFIKDHGLADMQRNLNRTLESPTPILCVSWEHEGWTIQAQMIQAKDGCYTYLSAITGDYRPNYATPTPTIDRKMNFALPQTPSTTAPAPPDPS